MQKGTNKSYREKISQRVKQLMDAAGLEVLGFSDYLAISESHLYAILNGTRDLTEEVAEKIGTAFDLKGSQILRLNYRIPKSIQKSKFLNNFYDENRNVQSYFQSTRSERKDSYYIENYVMNSSFFDSPVYIWEIKEYCEAEGRKYTSRRLSQILNYMVDRKKLKSKKRRLKLRNGGYGKRVVDVFFR